MAGFTSKRTHVEAYLAEQAKRLAEQPAPVADEPPVLKVWEPIEPVANPESLQAWPAFRDYFASVATGDARKKWPGIAALFERHCRPQRVDEITEETLTWFVNSMASEGLPVDIVRAKLSSLRGALKWGFDAGVVGPEKFPVSRRPCGTWIWNRVRDWREAAA